MRSSWLRQELHNFKLRLKALEVRAAETGAVPAEAQVTLLECKREQDVASGENETAHPGYLGSQDTFYVGTLKGVGRVYQQTFIDTHWKIACAKHQTTQTPITEAGFLNDKVLPLFEKDGLPMLRILTVRGNECCGRPENHDNQLYLAVNDIAPAKTKAKSPQTNGICERFHRTVLHALYLVVVRNQGLERIVQLQKELDTWIVSYNTERTHQGKMCCGRTPLETLIDGKAAWAEERLG